MTAQVPENDLELWSLTEAMCDGTITVTQRDRLQVLLEAGRSAMRFYLAYLDQHASMLWEMRGTTEAVPALEEPNALEEVFRRPVLGFLTNSARWTREYFSQPGPLSILAATIFMVCLISILMILPAPTYQPSRSNHVCTTSTSGTGFQPVKKEGKLNFVARITGLHNCRWSDNYLPPLRYAHLGLGRELKLDAGLLEITYYNGAKVVLEGPVEFTVEKPNACRLDVGKLAAKVSKKAVGFTVETPTATIVDLGTEFGVEVKKETGDAAVHVFQGTVEAEVLGETGSTRKKFRLTQGQAVRIDAGQATITKLDADVVQFARVVRLISNTWTDAALGPMITGVTATASSHFPFGIRRADRTPQMAVDGSGLIDNWHTNKPHGNAWMSDNGEVTGVCFKVDLGGQFELAAMKVWNFNYGQFSVRGVKSADIYISSTGTGYPADNPADWTLLMDDQMFKQAPDTDTYDTPDVIHLGGVTASFVVLVINDNFNSDNSGDYVGLSEVQFFGSPVCKTVPKKPSHNTRELTTEGR